MNSNSFYPGVDAVELPQHDHDVEEDEREADGHQHRVVHDGLTGDIWREIQNHQTIHGGSISREQIAR